MLLSAFKSLVLPTIHAVVPVVAYSQCGEVLTDGIASRMDSCLQEPSMYTTRAMSGCVAVARDAWQVEMKKYLQLLIDSLPYPQKLELIASQTAWVEYYEKAQTWSTTLYYDVVQGTMWQPNAVLDDLEMVRSRAQQLRQQYCTYRSSIEE